MPTTLRCVAPPDPWFGVITFNIAVVTSVVGTCQPNRGANLGTETLDDDVGHFPLAHPNGFSQVGYVPNSCRAILGSSGCSEVELPPIRKEHYPGGIPWWWRCISSACLTFALISRGPSSGGPFSLLLCCETTLRFYVTLDRVARLIGPR